MISDRLSSQCHLWSDGPFSVFSSSDFPNLQRPWKATDPFLHSPIVPCIVDERHPCMICRVCLVTPGPRYVPTGVHDHLDPKICQPSRYRLKLWDWPALEETSKFPPQCYQNYRSCFWIPAEVVSLVARRPDAFISCRTFSGSVKEKTHCTWGTRCL